MQPRAGQGKKQTRKQRRNRKDEKRGRKDVHDTVERTVQITAHATAVNATEKGAQGFLSQLSQAKEKPPCLAGGTMKKCVR